MFSPSCKLVMTSEYQNMATRAHFTNEDTLQKYKDLQIEIGNRIGLIQNRNDAFSHVAATLKNAYAKIIFPVDCE